MKTLSAELAAVCYGGNVQAVADLFTITLADATVLRWTPFDVSLSFGGNTWTNPGIYLDTPVARDALGLEVATTRISLASATVTIGGVSVQQAAVLGAFRGARVDIYRTYMTTPGTVPGIVQRFSGKVSDVEPGSLRVGLTVRSFTAELDQVLPRRITAAMCPLAVYSPPCGATIASFTTAKTVSSATRKVINWSGATSNATVDGWIEFTSGALTGKRATIAEVNATPATQATLSLNLPVAPAVGDGFKIIRGCNKLRSDCAVFARLAAYGGMPEMPAEEST